MNNIFLGGGSDPLLSVGQPPNYDAQIAELQRMQQALEMHKQQINQARPEAAGSPVWDEIEKLTAELSDKEFNYISNCDEFNKSQQAIAEALQAEYTKLMRPIVERNHRQLLDDHLQLLKRLRKEAGREIDKRMELFNEYVTTSPDIPFAEFIKNKKTD